MNVVKNTENFEDKHNSDLIRERTLEIISKFHDNLSLRLSNNIYIVDNEDGTIEVSWTAITDDCIIENNVVTIPYEVFENDNWCNVYEEFQTEKMRKVGA